MRIPLSTILALLLSLAAAPSRATAQTAAPSPAATAAAATKTLFLIRDPDGGINPIRAVSTQQQGTVLILVNERGGRAVVQARSVVAQLPLFTVEEVENGAADPAVLAAKYDLAAHRFPSLHKMLEDVAAGFHAIEKRRADEALARKQAAEAKVQAVTATAYDPAANYPAETLTALLAAAEAVRTEVPAAADRISQWETPFRDHLDKLKAGSQYLNGVWVTREALEEKARAEHEATFQKSLENLQLPAVALPAGVMGSAVNRLKLTAAILILVGLGFLVLGRRRFVFRALGVALIAASPLILAIPFFLATRTPPLLPAGTAPADVTPVLAVFKEVRDLGPGATVTTHPLTENELNTFLARFVRIARQADPSGQAALRQALAVRLLPGRILVFELLRYDHRLWVVRYDLAVPPAAGAPWVLVGVKLGALTLPPKLAQPLWKNLQSEISAALATLQLTGRFDLQPPTDGAVNLIPHTEPPAATPAPAESAPPAPAGSPVSATPAPVAATPPASEAAAPAAATIPAAPAALDNPTETTAPASSADATPAQSPANPDATPGTEVFGTVTEPSPPATTEAAPADSPTPAPTEPPAPSATEAPATPAPAATPAASPAASPAPNSEPLSNPFAPSAQ